MRAERFPKSYHITAPRVFVSKSCNRYVRNDLIYTCRRRRSLPSEYNGIIIVLQRIHLYIYIYIYVYRVVVAGLRTYNAPRVEQRLEQLAYNTLVRPRRRRTPEGIVYAPAATVVYGRGHRATYTRRIAHAYVCTESSAFPYYYYCYCYYRYNFQT